MKCFSFEELVEHLNVKESEYDILCQQYLELKKIILYNNTDIEICKIGQKFPTKTTRIENKIPIKHKSSIKQKGELQQINCRRHSTKISDVITIGIQVKERIKALHIYLQKINNYKRPNMEQNKFLNELREYVSKLKFCFIM